MLCGRNELPYAILANALTTEVRCLNVYIFLLSFCVYQDAEVQAAIIGLMNAIINHDTGM